MGYRVENIIFFPEKNEFLISRAGRLRVVAFNQGGELMVRLRGFENYYLCVKTGEVFSKRSSNSFSPLKKHLEGGQVYYYLFLNGNRIRTPLFRILSENLKEIEAFFSKNSGFWRQNRTTSEELQN